MNRIKIAKELIKIAGGLTKKTAGKDIPIEDGPAAVKALNAMAKAAKLPNAWVNPDEVLPIEIPEGFKSLFTEIVIRVSWQKDGNDWWGQVSWNYSHPSGGSNGKSIGTVESHDGHWYYRLEVDKHSRPIQVS